MRVAGRTASRAALARPALEITPLSGEEVQELVSQAYDTNPAIVEKLSAIVK